MPLFLNSRLRRHPRGVLGGWLALATGTLTPLPAQTYQATPADFAELSLEDLLSVRVTSVSRKEELSFGASAAIYVIGAEDLRQLAPSDLPSALRFAPGVQVGRIDVSNTALSPRGFNDVSANKLLALIDGRSIYTPLFGGVAWARHTPILQDLARIEVIRGPGATLWGSNAVNGVVNITTKSAHETVGSLVSASIGERNEHTFAVRHGFSVNAFTDARVYAQSQRQAAYDRAVGGDADLETFSTGFRLDHRNQLRNTFSLSGNFNTARNTVRSTTASLLPPYQTSRDFDRRDRSAYLMADYRHTTTRETEVSLKSYVDLNDSESASFADRRFLADVEVNLRHDFGRHDVVAGAGMRHYRDELDGTEGYQFEPANMRTWLYTAFVQDEITLVPDHWTVTVGSKLEHNDFTGWEIQPGIRTAWREGMKWTLWSSVARAVRTPTRVERGTVLRPLVIPPSATAPFPTLVELATGPSFDNESLTAYEAGFRARLSETVSFDLATYLNDYEGLRSVEPAGVSFRPTPVPHLVYRRVSDNGLEGRTYGFEALLNWQAHAHWRLQGSWATIHYDLDLAPGSMDVESLQATPGSSPRHEFKLLSEITFDRQWICGVFVWHQTELAGIGVPAYTGLNVNLTWQAAPGWELSLTGEDLLDRSHPEFPPNYLGGPTDEIPRSVRFSVTWRH